VNARLRCLIAPARTPQLEASAPPCLHVQRCDRPKVRIGRVAARGLGASGRRAMRSQSPGHWSVSWRVTRWSVLCLKRHMCELPPMKSSASAQARSAPPSARTPRWFASRMIENPIPAVASASETVSPEATQQDVPPTPRSGEPRQDDGRPLEVGGGAALQVGMESPDPREANARCRGADSHR